ncbi:MAG: class I SAM-dependent methyltransferase [Bacteroidota bacterium]
MQIQEAVELIVAAKPLLGEQPVKWLELGAGSGTFTQALARILPAGSTIYATDLRPQHLPSTDTVNIHSQRLDFLQDELSFSAIDGILMANSLHYVQNKSTFLRKLKPCLHSMGRLIVVEYNTESANHWVPYPISFPKLAVQAKTWGFTSVMKLGERTSVYQNGGMYAAHIS